MKINCEKCSHIQEITYDNLIFESEDEEAFVTYLSLEMSKNHLSERDYTPMENKS